MEENEIQNKKDWSKYHTIIFSLLVGGLINFGVGLVRRDHAAEIRLTAIESSRFDDDAGDEVKARVRNLEAELKRLGEEVKGLDRLFSLKCK